MAAEEREVVITLKTVGPARPTMLRVPSPVKVCDLRRLVATAARLPAERLKLVLRGKTLLDSKNGNGDDASISLENGDSLVVAVMPKPPAKHLQEDDDGDDDDLKFQIPQSTSWWKRRIFNFLHEKLRLPDILLMAIFSISLKAWACIILWFSLAPVAHRWGIGPPYILGTGFLLILINLGKRQHGDLRAAKEVLDVTDKFTIDMAFNSRDEIIKWSYETEKTIGIVAVAQKLDNGVPLVSFWVVRGVNITCRIHGGAYSIFNDDFRELPGTLNADRLDRDIRAGQL